MIARCGLRAKLYASNAVSTKVIHNVVDDISPALNTMRYLQNVTKASLMCFVVLSEYIPQHTRIYLQRKLCNTLCICGHAFISNCLIEHPLKVVDGDSDKNLTRILRDVLLNNNEKFSLPSRRVRKLIRYFCQYATPKAMTGMFSLYSLAVIIIIMMMMMMMMMHIMIPMVMTMSILTSASLLSALSIHIFLTFYLLLLAFLISLYIIIVIITLQSLKASGGKWLQGGYTMQS